jgi:SAM-dependent methyltransferase
LWTSGMITRGLTSWLDNPWLWEASRLLLDRGLGLYQRRLRLLHEWGVLAGQPSVLDIGCGIGQYAQASEGPYLGIDLNSRYIEHARKRRGGGNKRFHCADGGTLGGEGRRFDLVLMVDFLHHIPDDGAVELLGKAKAVSAGHVASFEPVLGQTNPLGRWIVANDRGHFIRPLATLQGLFTRAGLSLTRSTGLDIGPLRTHAILCKGAAAP